VLDKENMEKLLTAQNNEITEFFIYDKLSWLIKDSHNRDILEQMSREELEHHNYWKEHTNRAVKPSKLRIWTSVLISRILGLTFGIKPMGKAEEKAQIDYKNISDFAPEAAAEALRQDGFEGRVVMVTREERLPYDRTGLSKGFLKSDDTEPEMLRTADFYDEYDIEILTKHAVSGIDVANKKVGFQGDTSLKYDKLLLAPGSIPRSLSVPGASLENISTLRNPDNANFIKSSIQDGSRIVIIGASFIGMEAAASLSERDISITIVAPESVPFERTLGKEIGKMYKELHKENGISFRLEAKVTRFAGNGKVEEVILGDGEKLPADFVLMGVGVQPATGFLKGVDLNPDGSLSVDRNFQVAEDIYAAGDIASFIDWRTGERIRIEHWRLAEQHGRVAAHNMAGKEAEYCSIPFFWTNQLGVNLGYMGYVNQSV
jgi:NADPH-dependent 2,4-dienoyl-CoA reductase/sulfur reductase-like enzyme